MPRRPRPTARPAPKTKTRSAPKTNISTHSQPIKFTQAESESDEEERSEDGSSASASSDHQDSLIASELEDDEGVDLDGPRVAQWEPDDFDGAIQDEGEDDEGLQDIATPSSARLTSLQNDLSSLPLGALRKAQRTLVHADATVNSEDSNLSGEELPDDGPRSQGIDLKGKRKEKQEWSTKPRMDLAKRANKHAPQEVTSKRPITRRRTVVDVKVQQARDPRFLPMTGEFSDRKFQEQYDFLAEIRTSELKTLRDNLKRAKKLLASSPQDLREERQEEVGRLERALKRAESSVNKDRREKVEQTALSQFTKDEREKRKQGKGGWWMKQTQKKELLVRARYDALAATGGKGAVKKAIEKKQKKLSQKEKKSRPFARPSGRDGQGSILGKRASSFDSRAEGSQFNKRRKVE